MSATTTGESPAKVLILEDDPGVSRLQSRRLERAGYRVTCVGELEQARNAITDDEPDLLILDYQLSGPIDGLEFHRQLHAEGLELPVILVTGRTDDRLIVSALRAGVRDYVTKSPEYLEYLPEAVGRILKQERDTRERRLAEAALREANRMLETAMQELRHRTDELQATTQQLWQAAKLASVGELAASIAHELNNPLGTISLRLETIMATVPETAPCRPMLEVLEGEVERMAGLIQNLLNFSRPSQEQIIEIDLAEEISKTVELASYHFRRRNVEIEFEFAVDLPKIPADRQKLRQVFLNLFTNACDAMVDGGVLKIRTAEGHCRLEKPALVVEVSDTGTGIPADLVSKVMDPFVSTKAEGKGTGLGLAICRRIVHEHHGNIEILSAEGFGTTVRITLPIRSPVTIAD